MRLSYPIIVAPILLMAYVALRVRLSYDEFVIPHANRKQHDHVMAYRPLFLQSESLTAAPPEALRRAIREWNGLFATKKYGRLLPASYDDWVLDNTIRGQIARSFVTAGNTLLSHAGVDPVTRAGDAEQVFYLTEHLRRWDATSPTVVAVLQRRCLEEIGKVEFGKRAPILERLRKVRTPMAEIFRDSMAPAQFSYARMKNARLTKNYDAFLKALETLAEMADANVTDAEYMAFRKSMPRRGDGASASAPNRGDDDPTLLDSLTFAITTDRKTTKRLLAP